MVVQGYMVSGGLGIYGEWCCTAIWCMVVYRHMVHGGVRINGEWWCKDIR